MAETRLVLGKTPKLRLVPWGCGSWARSTALGITHRSVWLLGKAKANWSKSLMKATLVGVFFHSFL